MTMILEAWEQSFNGFHWWDMHGDDEECQKLNFALWRRGEIKMEEMRFDADQADGGGLALVRVHEVRTALSIANERRSVAAAQRRAAERRAAMARGKKLVFKDTLTPSQNRNRMAMNNARSTRVRREQILQCERQMGLKRRYETLRRRCASMEKPLQMLREAWREMGQKSTKVDNLLQGATRLQGEAQAVMMDRALDVMERRLDDRDAMRERAEDLAKGLDLTGKRARAFCEAAQISPPMVRDLVGGRCQASLARLPRMLAVLEEWTAVV